MNIAKPRNHRAGWMRAVLVTAGVYNLIWGALVILAPNALFRFADMQAPLYPQIWQCVGMIVGVYGVGYLVAAADPIRHWPITLVGLLGKVFGPIGFIGALVSGDLPLSFGVTILTNDLIWWIPFGAILYQALISGRRGALESPVDNTSVSNSSSNSVELLDPNPVAVTARS